MRNALCLTLLVLFASLASGCYPKEHACYVRDASVAPMAGPADFMYGPCVAEGKSTVLVWQQEGRNFLRTFHGSQFERMVVELPENWEVKKEYDMNDPGLKIHFSLGSYEGMFKVNERQEGAVYVYEDRGGLMRVSVCGKFYLRKCQSTLAGVWKDEEAPLQEYLVCSEFHFMKSDRSYYEARSAGTVK